MQIFTTITQHKEKGQLRLSFLVVTAYISK